MSDLQALEDQIRADIAAADGEAALEAVRIATLGKKGTVSALLATLGRMTPDERNAQGPLFNGLKDRVTEALASRRDALKTAALNQRLNTETVDVTLPVREPAAEIGRIHPISQVIDELTAIFAEMGFAVAEGPDIETDDYNFTKLNFPEGHPARDMHDTFFFNPKPDGSRLLLRTHTSPVQVRTMLTQKPPIRVIIPGRTYRCDSDQTHTPMFHQVEGLVIDKGSHLGHLKWILAEFCKAFFEVDDVKMRFRPSYFPFTEPSLEVDIQCRREKGEIRFGEGEDWLEILGCGMVHPNVLRNCGLDPDEYQGFAWGMGIDRIAMLKYGMPDLRAFFEVDRVGMRFRPSYFPFTEPSLEVDIQCRRDKGEIRFGEGNDWLEVLGCGMVHPNVLRNCGLDPDEYQGFAWGMGIERIAALKYGMPDLRAFFDADVRWLSHYGFRPLDFPTLAGGLSA